MKLLMKKSLNQKGFTLFEIIAVIVILAIIAVIAIPSIGNIIENSRFNAVKSDAIRVIEAANLFYADNPDESDEVLVSTLKSNNYLETVGKILNDSSVTKALPRKILTPESEPITFSGTKKVRFAEVTIDDISNDTKKGSEFNNYEVYIILPK